MDEFIRTEDHPDHREHKEQKAKFREGQRQYAAYQKRKARGKDAGLVEKGGGKVTGDTKSADAAVDAHDSRIKESDRTHCHVCGREASVKWRFCPKCGNKVN